MNSGIYSEFNSEKFRRIFASLLCRAWKHRDSSVKIMRFDKVILKEQAKYYRFYESFMRTRSINGDVEKCSRGVV
jgi:hypothetical protein